MAEQCNKKVPQIRFKGFAGEWEEKALGSIADIKTGPFGSTLHAEDYVENGDPIITTEHFKSGELPDKKKGIPQVCRQDYIRLKCYMLQAGDIVFSRVGSVDINAHVKKGHKGWLFSGRVLRVRTSAMVDSEYLHHELSTSRVKKSVVSRAVGQTMPSINTEILKETPIELPVCIKEQERIGEYMVELDRMIGLHQQKHEKLVSLKKAMLKKMFPQKGATAPEIRFKGLSEPWEEKKLGKVANFSKGQGYSKGDLVKSGSPIILYGRLYTNYQTDISEVDTFVFERKGAVKSTGSEVIVPSSGETSEDIARASAVSKAGLLLGGDLNIILPSSTINPYFLALTLSNGKPQKNLARRAQGKSVVHIRNADLEAVEIQYPFLKEQQKIGTYFRQLDELTAQHSAQVDKLKQLKTACLEKMFV